MKTTTITAVSFALFLFGTTASAHLDDESLAQELQENCIVCCLASRPSLHDEIKLNENKCTDACGAYVQWILETLN